VPRFNDEQTYYFFDNYEDILLPGYNEFYLVVEKLLNCQTLIWRNLKQGRGERGFYHTPKPPYPGPFAVQAQPYSLGHWSKL
jgi:hypothetical protein